MGFFDTDDLIIVPLNGAVSMLAAERARLVVCDQNTEEWYTARNGIPTGSVVSRIVTPKGKPRKGKAVEEFAYELAMDSVYGRDMEHYVSRAMELGQINEPKARKLWSELSGVDVKTVGFVYYDDRMKCGCSPDGLFERDGRLGCLEIKSLQRKAMCGFMPQADEIEIPPDHYAQLQFNMWCCGCTLGSYVVYYDSHHPLIIERTVEVDQELVAGFDEAVPSFLNMVDVAKDRLVAARGKLQGTPHHWSE